MGATPWGPFDPYFVDPPPATYGEPVPMTTDLIAAGQYALEQSGTYPAFGYTRDGALFMFSVHDGQLVARPYLPVPGTVGDAPSPQPTGAPIFEAAGDYLKNQAARSVALPGELLRAASREFEREVASVGSGGPGPADPAASSGPSPTGISIKSIETPGYLQGVAPIFAT